MADEQNEGFCTKCGFVIKSFEGLEKCPSCGSEGVQDLKDDHGDVETNMTLL